MCCPTPKCFTSIKTGGAREGRDVLGAGVAEARDGSSIPPPPLFPRSPAAVGLWLPRAQPRRGHPRGGAVAPPVAPPPGGAPPSDRLWPRPRSARPQTSPRLSPAPGHVGPAPRSVTGEWGCAGRRMGARRAGAGAGGPRRHGVVRRSARVGGAAARPAPTRGSVPRPRPLPAARCPQMGSSRGRSPHGSPRGLQFRALRVSGRAPQLPVPCVPPSGAADAARPLSSIPFAVTFPTAPLSSLLLPSPPSVYLSSSAPHPPVTGCGARLPADNSGDLLQGGEVASRGCHQRGWKPSPTPAEDKSAAIVRTTLCRP